MRGHGCIHLAAGIDDCGADETGIEVVVHRNVGMVGPHVRRCTLGRRRAVIDEPFVDCALVGWYSITDWSCLVNFDGRSVVGVERAFVEF